MKAAYVALEETDCFDSLFLDYLQQKEALRPFYGVFPDPAHFGQLIEKRGFSNEKRMALLDTLVEQYGPYQVHDAVDFNIHSLKNPKTFTVTTGHQLNIFTGPLYFIYKIVTVIKTCQALKQAYPDCHFVPVYWMASEDHDFAEIASFHLFGKKYTWETQQKGPVGRFKPLSINQIIDQLPERVPLFEQAYLDHSTLAGAVRHYVNALFGEYGVVVVDADHPRLKAQFASIMERDILEHHAHRLVEQASVALEQAGYKGQAFSREVNFFYMENGLRERIVQESDGYQVLNTDKHFTPDQLRLLIRQQPAFFSPNVIMRPVYQEVILPNLAYVGGPAEMAYWLQLRGVFDHYQVPFPALMPRHFALLVSKPVIKKMSKVGLTSADLFKSTHQLKENFLSRSASTDYHLTEETAALDALFERMRQKAEVIDPTLTGYIGAEGAKAQKILEHISKRLKKAEEQHNETALQQIDAVKEKLFPGGSLQERHDNFLNFYLNNPRLIQELAGLFVAFDFRFQVLYEE